MLFISLISWFCFLLQGKNLSNVHGKVVSEHSPGPMNSPGTNAVIPANASSSVHFATGSSCVQTTSQNTPGVTWAQNAFRDGSEKSTGCLKSPGSPFHRFPTPLWGWATRIRGQLKPLQFNSRRDRRAETKKIWTLHFSHIYHTHMTLTSYIRILKTNTYNFVHSQNFNQSTRRRSGLRF